RGAAARGDRVGSRDARGLGPRFAPRLLHAALRGHLRPARRGAPLGRLRPRRRERRSGALRRRLGMAIACPVFRVWPPPLHNNLARSSDGARVLTDERENIADLALRRPAPSAAIELRSSDARKRRCPIADRTW